MITADGYAETLLRGHAVLMWNKCNRSSCKDIAMTIEEHEVASVLRRDN